MFFFFKFIFIVLPVLICVAFLTLMERKLLSIIGLRLGPNKVFFLGILQPVSDAFKLANKNLNLMTNFSFFFYYISSFLMISSSIFLFSIMLFYPSAISMKYSILFLFLILGLNSFNAIMAGWSSFSKFSLIGSIRTVSQLISYEGSLYLCLFFLIIIFCSFDFCSFNFINFYILGFMFFPCLYIWLPTILAELNRTPFDFSEGESELVSGFNTEFGSVCFTLIFLGEYANIIFFCLISSMVFFYPIFFFFFLFLFFIIWIRSVLPRLRFDKLMMICWKFFIPFLTFFYMIFFMFFY